MGIFNENAPRLWAAGLPVMPLYPRDKTPIVNNWQQFAERMPTPDEQAFWLKNHENSNIGLPLGPQSGCIALDIDTEDADLIKIIESLVPISPWNRIGAKGKVMLFKYTGQKTFRIKDIDGKTICECLSARTQIVIPPSIHPKTQKPYVADRDITEAIKMLPTLNPEIETILRAAFMDYGITLSHSGWTRTTDYVSQGSRDVKMTSMAGFFANGITRGELSLKEAIGRMRAWHSSCVEKVAGDDVDIEKGIRNMISFLVQDVIGPRKKPLPRGWDDGISEDEKKAWGLNFDVEVEEWTYTQLRDYLVEQFSLSEPDSVQRTEAIEYVLARIARSPNLTSLDEDRILKYITQQNKNIMLSAVRKRLNELKMGSIKGTDHTEIAQALLLELKKYGEVRFHNDNFWCYNGSHWEIMEEQKILSIIAKEFGNLPAASKANDHRGVLRVLQSIIEQGITTNTNVTGVNFANGFVTPDGKIHPHSPVYGMTYTLPYRYLPEMNNLERDCPRFADFLKNVWGHYDDYEQRIKALREAIAETFFGMGTSFSRAILLYGVAQSGKSQLLTIVSSLFPPQALSYVTPYKFEDKFEVTELSRSIMNVCGELKEKVKIPGAMFKQIIDGSRLNGQYKGRQVFSFTPKATHWFASNYLPKTDDATEGFNRRWLILSFDKTVPTANRVRGLGDMIVAEEREAIASWAVSCIMRLSQAGDLTLPSSHFKFMGEMASENDTLFFFLTSEKGPRKSKEGIDCAMKIHADKLYESYSAFCYSTPPARPVGSRRYLQRLRELATFMGYKVDDMMVYGLTMEKDAKTLAATVPLTRDF